MVRRPYLLRMSAKKSLLDELSWRGMIYQHTDGLPDALATVELSAYAGFDPTASCARCTAFGGLGTRPRVVLKSWEFELRGHAACQRNAGRL